MNNNHSTLELVGPMPAIQLAPAPIAERDKLIVQARAIGAVLDPPTQERATAVGKQLRSLLNQAEKDRKEIGTPVRELTTRINELAADYSQPIHLEINRLGQLVSQFQLAEAERVAAAERKRQAEIAAAEAARREAEQAAQKVAEFTDEATLQKAIEAEEAAKKAKAAADVVICAPPPAPIKAKGSVVRKEMRWEVTDIHALYAARQDLVRLEPNAAAIRATVVVGQPAIPGLKVWEETQTSFR